jgi:hypothetical protein
VIKLVRRGRTQLSVQIKDDSFNKLQAIKDETGLSNAKIIEMLLDSYTNTNTNTSNNTNTGNFVTEERVKELIQRALSGPDSSEPVEEEKPIKKLITMTPEEIEASCTYEDVSPPIPEWDEQKWLDEDYMEFSNDPNPPEIKPKTATTDEDPDW